ncbi:MAG: hypothetical protein R3F56_02405 [Planctomycetota bacterium]
MPLARLPALVVLLVLGVLVYGPPALHAQHLNFDDPFFFGPASAFASDGLGRILDPRQTIANAYLPVAHLTLYFDWLLGGSDAPAIPRLHSMLWHVAVAFALARLLGRLSLPAAPAVAAAALFLVHPALVESVAWSSSRKDLVSGFFAILCLSACIDHARQPTRRRLWLAAVWAGLAMYAKATAVVLAPLAALLVWWTPARRAGAWRAVLVVAVVVALAAWHHAALAAREGTLAGSIDAGLGARAAQVPGAYAHYLGKLVWPLDLDVLYPEVLTLESFARKALSASALLLSVAVAALVALRAPRWRLAGLGLLAVLAALAPFNTAVPASSIAAADRYLYLVVPWAVLALAAASARLAVPVCTGLAVACAFLTLGRVPAFASSAALWRASLARDERNAVACLNLTLTPEVAGDRQEVRRLLEQAVEWARYPQHRLRAESALSSLAWQDGRREAAVRHAGEALAAARALPDGDGARHERVRLSLRAAVMAQTSGHPEQAATLAQDALTLEPEHPAVLAYLASSMLRAAHDAHGKLLPDATTTRREAFRLLDLATARDATAVDPYVVRGQWLAAFGENLGALKAYDDALARDPGHADAHHGKVDLLLAQELFSAAEAAARAAIAAHVDDANLLSKLGMALAGQRKFDEARGFYEAYLRLRPADADVRRLLAAVLVLQTRPLLFQLPPEQLEPRAERIRELDPRNPAGALVLAVARRLQRRLQEALVLLEGVRDELKDEPDVIRLLAETHRDLGYQLLLTGKERARAVDHFVAFARLAPADVSTDAVHTLLEQECVRQEDEGVLAFGDDRLDDAEAKFRRCLEILPGRAWTKYQLGLTLLKKGGDHVPQALDLFRAAESGLRAEGHDCGLAVLYQVLALQQLGKEGDASETARAFVAQAENRDSAAFARIEALAR